MKVLFHIAVLLMVIAALAAAPATIFAQSAKPRLEDELVDDLLKDLPKARPETPAKGKTTRPAAKDEAEKKLLQDLEGGEDVGLPPENPLIRIGQKMRSSQERIAGKDTSAETQTGQKEILSELAKLITAAHIDEVRDF